VEWIVGLVVVLIVGAVWAGVLDNRKASQMEDEVRDLADFDAADVYVSPHNHAGVAIDRNRHEILLTDKKSIRIFHVESVISCEVLEDGMQIAYANRGSQVLGMAVGGALLGGVGAVIGGLSGSQRTMQRVQSVVLRFTTDDFDNPVHEIVVGKAMHKGMEKDGLLYLQVIELAQKWHARTVAMMKAASPEVAPK